MRTNKEFVSRVIGDLKGLTKDGRVPPRLVLSIGQDKARFLMSQKLDELTLFKEEGIISTISCFEMEEVPEIECKLLDISGCKSVMKSIKKLPEGLFGKNGSGIIHVASVDNSLKFDYTNPRMFRDIEKVRFKRKGNGHYMIINGHLYLMNSEVEMVYLQMFALKKYEVEERCACQSDNLCKSYWDYEFVCPDRFYDLVVKDTLTEMANIYRTSVEDSNPNLDVNQKGKTEA